MNAKSVILAKIGECLALIESPAKATEQDRKEHRRLVAREYARNSKAGVFAQSDLFKHTREGVVRS